MDILRKILRVTFLSVVVVAASPLATNGVFAADDEQSDREATASSDVHGMSGAMGKGGMMGTMCRKGMMSHHGCGCGRSDMGMPGGDLSRHIEGRIAFLKAEIGITDSQTVLWNAFAEALRGMARMKAEAVKKADHGKSGGMEKAKAMTMPLADHLAHHETMLAARFAAVKTLRESYGKLHEKLTDQQKATADALVSPYVSHM